MPTKITFASETDLMQVRIWSEAGCLIPFEDDKFALTQAVAICGDGRRAHMPMWAINTFLSKAQRSDYEDPASFRFESLGIAMGFGDNNPIEPDDLAYKFFAPQFRTASSLVGNGSIEQLNLIHHWPCARGKMAGLSLEASVVWTLMSKCRIKRAGLFPQVAAHLWVDRAPNRYDIWRMKLDAFARYFRARELYPERFGQAETEAVAAK